MVGMGGAIYDTLGIVTRREPTTHAVTLGVRTEQNPYGAELAAMALTMRYFPHHLVGRQITVYTSNRGTLHSASQPKHQSGLASIEELYNAVHAARKRGNLFGMDPIPWGLRPKQKGRGSNTKSYRTWPATGRATPPGQIHGDKWCQDKERI